MRWLVLLALSSCVTLSPVDQALSLSRQERRSEAEQLLKKDLAEHPDDIPARKLLIRFYGFDGDLGAAQAQVDELRARVKSGDPSPEIELGHAYELAHKFDEALAAYALGYGDQVEKDYRSFREAVRSGRLPSENLPSDMETAIR